MADGRPQKAMRPSAPNKSAQTHPRKCRALHKIQIVFCLVLVFACAAAFAAVAPVVKAPNLRQTDRSGQLGKEMNYLCLRQLGADCRDRLALDQSGYLKELFTQAKPGQNMREHQIRPLAVIVFAGAALLRFGSYDEKATGISHREMSRIVMTVTRELAEHHISNCDKSSSWWWGNEWQSALWSAHLAQAAWMMWDRLPAGTRRLVANAVVFEANRFLASPAPYNEISDTKAEENAWNSRILVLAECMMPEHANRAAWDNKAKEYMVTAFATPQDLTSTKLIDGKPLKEWLRGPNVHSDFTLENHGFFHPDYGTAFYLNMQNLMIYRLAGREAPQSAFHNVAEMHDIIDFLTLPSGWTYYPQSTDWNNYRHDVTVMGQSPNPVMPSAAGARCLRWGLDFIKYADGLDAGKTSQNLFRGQNFNCCPLDTLTHLYLLHCLFGPGAEPMTDEQAREALSGTRVFELGKVALCRSRSAMASFSWFDSGKRLMAAVTPMTPDCVVLPKFRSLIGTIGPKLDEAKILHRETELLEGGGFIVRAQLQRGPEFAVNETVTMVALADGRVVWVEWFGNQPASELEVRAGLVFFETDPFWLHGADAKVYYRGGASVKPAKPVVLSDARWLNISDKLGIALRGSKAVSIEDGQLVLNYRPAGGGEIAPCSVVVFYPNASREATVQASEQLKIEGLGGGAVKIDLGDRQLTLKREF